MNTSPPFRPLGGGRGLQLGGGPPRQGAEDGRGEAAAGVAVAGRVGRAGLQAGGRPVGDDPRHGVAAGVVVGEHLREEAPDGRDGVEHAVAVAGASSSRNLDADLVEHLAGRKPSLRAKRARS